MSENMNKKVEVISEIVKHLPGQHDQASHAGKGGFRSGGGLERGDKGKAAESAGLSVAVDFFSSLKDRSGISTILKEGKPKGIRWSEFSKSNFPERARKRFHEMGFAISKQSETETLLDGPDGWKGRIAGRYGYNTVEIFKS